jgi:alkylhydroperoxidase/carboxymuconolactone decarboxylase family protein YurZ
MRAICTVSCLAAQRLFPETEIHIASALHLGWKPNEIRETLLQLVYVAGFPVAIEAIKVLNGLLDTLQISREPLSLEKIWGLASYEEKQGDRCETIEHGGKADTIERLVPGKGFDEINWAAKGNHMATLIYGKELWQKLKMKSEGLSTKGPNTLVESIFGQIMARPVIDAETRSMCLITSLLARRDMQGVKQAISGAFASGSDQKKIRELIYQMTMYVGWPTCIDALSVLDELSANKRPGQ